ncbi:hypothetical protein Bbelb_137430 [Branchiostoma belcheri]|nr:hypothetical protein Bbelb_137430 [Branchiostoma belcheri]
MSGAPGDVLCKSGVSRDAFCPTRHVAGLTRTTNNYMLTVPLDGRAWERYNRPARGWHPGYIRVGQRDCGALDGREPVRLSDAAVLPNSFGPQLPLRAAAVAGCGGLRRAVSHVVNSDLPLRLFESLILRPYEYLRHPAVCRDALVAPPEDEDELFWFHFNPSSACNTNSRSGDVLRTKWDVLRLDTFTTSLRLSRA